MLRASLEANSAPNEFSGGSMLSTFRHSSLVICACTALLAAAALCLPTTQAAEPSTGGEWEMYNKTLDGARYSPLRQINKDNAARLTEVCRFQVADKGSFQAGPVMVQDTLYITSTTDTLALDPATCAIKWRHSYHRTYQSLQPTNRGIAYLNGRVYRGTDDGRLLALDARTGQELWSSVVGDGPLGEFISGAPIAWNGLVFIGTAGGELGFRGRVLAFDAASGREVWRFWTVPTGKERGAETWGDSSWATHGGGGTWSSFALDPLSAELFVPVGNPVPDFGPAQRPGTNLFTSSVLVLDARSGALRWWYQLSPSDAFDYDLGAAPALFSNSQHAPMVAAAGKDGFLYVIDRTTHKLAFKTPVTTVDTVKKPPTATSTRACPGIFGGVEWNGPAFVPESNLVVVGAVDYCMFYRAQPAAKWLPGLNYGGSWSPGVEQPSGWITAVDADSGKVRWKYHTEAPVTAAVTPTAGGIVMGGDTAGNFLVFDVADGKLLKTVQTRGAIAGGIATYEIAGRQYVAFTSGNVSRSISGAIGRPTLVVMAIPGEPETAARKSGPDALHGNQVFMTTCAICHGADGANIDHFNLPEVTRGMTAEQLVQWIKNPAPPMPKMFPEPLSPEDEQDIADVAAYLKSLK
jgi:alcohol dehydrogenase (cytochrome c)